MPLCTFFVKFIALDDAVKPEDDANKAKHAKEKFQIILSIKHLGKIYYIASSKSL